MSGKGEINPVKLALLSSCGFIARSSTKEKEGLKSVIKTALNTKGFSFVDIVQLCVVYTPNIYSRISDVADENNPFALGIFQK